MASVSILLFLCSPTTGLQLAPSLVLAKGVHIYIQTVAELR
jgi:hypothetical protein